MEVRSKLYRTGHTYRSSFHIYTEMTTSKIERKRGRGERCVSDVVLHFLIRKSRLFVINFAEIFIICFCFWRCDRRRHRHKPKKTNE